MNTATPAPPATFRYRGRTYEILSLPHGLMHVLAVDSEGHRRRCGAKRSLDVVRAYRAAQRAAGGAA